jgi:hypothetical protein
MKLFIRVLDLPTCGIAAGGLGVLLIMLDLRPCKITTGGVGDLTKLNLRGCRIFSNYSISISLSSSAIVGEMILLTLIGAGYLFSYVIEGLLGGVSSLLITDPSLE